jgi:N6-adenosine-specific RNA methylase IME4
MTATLKLVKLESVKPHPDNPRVVMREDVVGAIVANLGDEYPKKHAVHVRPVGDDYQLLSGHQRTEAARRKGLTEIWAWVEDLDDAAAFMELVTSNNQGELSPLEIGIHVLKAVPTSQGKRGKGLQSYADKIGKSRQYVQQIRSAADVAVTSQVDLRSLLLKSQHLCAIHGLPKDCWRGACEWLAEHDAPVTDVEKQATQAKEYGDSYDVPELWQDYLPKYACMSAVFAGTDPNNFRKLADLAVRVADDLKEHEDLAGKWREWLVANSGGESWDIRAVQAKRIELEEIQWDRDHAGAAEPKAVSLILADPPWQYDDTRTDNRRVENHYPTATVEEICADIHRPGVPPLADDCILFLWATAPMLVEALQVMEAWGFEYKTNAVWDKEKIGMGYWFRFQHEFLLVGTRGNPRPPAPEDRVSSVFCEARGPHSKKPECVYRFIEKAFPHLAKCELYQRGPTRPGWRDGFGNEAEARAG